MNTDNVINLADIGEAATLSQAIYQIDQELKRLRESETISHERTKKEVELLGKKASLQKKYELSARRSENVLKMTEEERAAQAEILKDVDEWLTKNDVYHVSTANRCMLYQNGKWHPLLLEALRVQDQERFRDKNWRKALDMRLREQGRFKTDMTYSVSPLPPKTLNMLRYNPLQPSDDTPHWFFGFLVSSICGGKVENVEHVEQLLVAKYRNPGDQTIPWLVLNDEGGTGKNLFAETILSTIFGANVVGTNLHINDIIGKYNSQIEGLLVGLINENPGDSYDHNKLKQVVGSRQIGFERKYMPRFLADNVLWGVMASNNATGTVQLANSDADRRFSIVFGSTPLRTLVAGRLSTTEDQAADWIANTGAPLLRDPDACAVWLGHLLQKWPAVKSVRALHGEDYRALLHKQKGMDELVFEAVFADPEVAFSYIKKSDLFDIYVHNSRRANLRYPKGRTSFYLACESWLKRLRPDTIEAKVKWKEGMRTSSADVYITGLLVERSLSSNTSTYFAETPIGSKQCLLEV